MATTTSTKAAEATKTSTPPFDVDFDAAAERIRGLNEKVVAAAKQTGTMSIDAYEQTMHTLLDFGQKAADATKVEQISELAKSQASVIAEVTGAYTKAVRDLLK
jgi:hypothetical protein